MKKVRNQPLLLQCIRITALCVFALSATICGLGDQGTAEAATVTLNPNAAGSNSGWTWTGGSVNYTNWLSADGNTSYAAAASSTLVQTVNLDDTGLSGIINSITAYGSCVQTTGNENLQLILRTGGTNYQGPNNVPVADSTTYTLYSNTWTNNPQTANPWTWSEVNALEAGVRTQNAGGWAGEIRCTQVYVVVDYTANTAPILSISQPNGATVTVGQPYSITYSLADSDNVVTAAFYYDTDNTGLNGTAISGACATAAEGSNVTCSWNTTGMTPGTYYVYGIANDGVNPAVSAYSPGTITINAGAGAGAGAAALLHNSETTSSSKWGGWGVTGKKYGKFTCDTCHIRSTTNIKRVRTSITAPDGTASLPGDGRPVVFDRVTGSPGDPGVMGDDSTTPRTTSNKICEVCHTYDAAGTNGTKVHPYSSLGAAINNSSHQNNSKDCTQCHKHNVGFKPAGCDSCHGNPPTAATMHGPTGLADDPYTTGSATPGAHNVHVTTLAYSCTNCHNGYVMPQESTAKPGFADISIGFSNFGSTTGSYSGQSNVSYNNTLGNGTMTCSTVYCHGSTINAAANPTWTGTVACGNCHGASAASPPTMGSHQKHAGSGAGQQNLACSKCHGATAGASGHVSGTVAWQLDTADTKIGAAASYKTGASGNTGTRAPSGVYGSCSTVYCHSSGQSSTGGPLTSGDYSAPQWGTAASGACGTCHKATKATGLTSGGHNAHLGAAGVSGCSDCHTGAANDGSSYTSVNHVNQLIDATGSYTAGGTPGNGYGTCSTAVCHANVYSTGTVTTPLWGAAAGCTACHTVAIDTTGPGTGSHVKHNVTDCSQCHASASNNLTKPTLNHVDGNIDVTNGYPPNVTKHAAGTYTGTCSTAICHANVYGTGTVTTPVWGTAAGCTACHSIAIDATGPNTGSHAKHNVTDCTQCHNAGTSQTTTPSTGHADGNIDVTSGYPLNVTKHAAGTYAGTCSTAVCHANVYSTGTVTTPVWGTAAGCAACHIIPIGATGPDTGSHLVHNVTDCSVCHAGATNNTTKPALNHLDGDIDVTNGYPLNVTKHAAGTYAGTCSTASCHDNGLGSPAPTPVWGTVVNDCSECHAKQPPTASHTRHLTGLASGFNRNAVCNDCHAGAVEGTTAPVQHLDNNLDVYKTAPGDLGYPQDAAKGGAPYNSCTTAYCHSNGLNIYKSATWGATSTGCNFCHSALPTTGAHARHVRTAATVYGSTSVSTTGGIYDFGCGNCHPVSIANHMNGMLDITLNKTHGGVLKSLNLYSTDTQGYTLVTTPVRAVTCSAAYCHSKGNNTFVTSSNWYGTFSGDSCGSCHGNSPDTGSHPTHVMPGIHYDTIFTGTIGLKPASNRTDITSQSTAVRPHGNSATATTINCNVCHVGTVSASYNRRNTQCSTCHTTGNAAIGDADMIIDAASTLHLNGVVNVQVLNAATARSKAQIRDAAPASWTRNNGYKSATLSSNDSTTINSADWATADKTCTTACHLSQKSPAWGSPITCDSCHTTLP